jgi:hypothetical protein
LTILEREYLNNHQFALTRQNAASEVSATFVNSSARGSRAVSSAEIISDSAVDVSSASAAMSQIPSAGGSGAISSAGTASGSAADASSASFATSAISSA